MKKVLLIHGFEGHPNGGWRPYLMAELEKLNIYACALPMPNPEEPKVDDWITEIARVIDRDPGDEFYFVGHSLGVPAILRYLESESVKAVSGAVLVAGPVEPVVSKKISNFLDREFDYQKIKSRLGKAVVVHGDNDQNVPYSHAQKLSKELECELITIKNGGHLNGSSGFTSLPEVLEALQRIFL